jgi:oligopeptide/dipeptide ABC transporter ATP-binding protein
MTPLLSVRDLVKHYHATSLFGRAAPPVRAVDGVSFEVGQGETLALVGESGCGKSSVGRTILRLQEPTSGSALFEGVDIFSLDRSDLRALRRRMQIIFQDPYSSLNPRMTVGAAIAEGIEIHRLAPRSEIAGRVAALLEEVGLDPGYARRYPHEFSGGQRQRIGIARALAVQPAFIVCDEPVSALDVSVQAQVLNLLADLQRHRGLSYLFIAHDLAVVRQIAHRIAVMYLGRIVEQGPTDQLLSHPRHPYTVALLSAVPEPDPSAQRDRIVLQGDLPSPSNPPPGCPFHTRCFHPLKDERCRTTVPPLRPVEATLAACHYAEATPTPAAIGAT